MTWREIKDAIESIGVKDLDDIAYIDIHPMSAKDITVDNLEGGEKAIWG